MGIQTVRFSYDVVRLTDWLTDYVGRGAPVDLNRAPMQRFSSDQIEHFVEFVLSPLISVDLPFGERNY